MGEKDEMECGCRFCRAGGSVLDTTEQLQRERESITGACVLQDRLDLSTGLKIDLLNGNPDAIIAVFNRVLEEIDKPRRQPLGSEGRRIGGVLCKPPGFEVKDESGKSLFRVD